MIKRLRVENFSCLADTEIQFERVNLLLGRSGTGKTALVQALDLFLALCLEGGQLDEVLDTEYIGAFSEDGAQGLEVELETRGARFLWRARTEQLPGHEPPCRLDEVLLRDGQPVYRQRRGRACWAQPDGTLPDPWAPTRARSMLRGLRESGWELGRPFFEQLSRTAWHCMFTPDAFDIGEPEEESLDSWAHNFQAWFRYLSRNRPAEVERALAELREVIPCAQPLVPPELPLARLSSGEQRLLVLYTVLHTELKPGSVLWLDDPVSGLCAADARRWLARAGEVAREEGAQLILSAQHPHVARWLQPDLTLTLDRPEGGPTRVRAVSPHDEELAALL